MIAGGVVEDAALYFQVATTVATDTNDVNRLSGLSVQPLYAATLSNTKGKPHGESK